MAPASHLGTRSRSPLPACESTQRALLFPHPRGSSDLLPPASWSLPCPPSTLPQLTHPETPGYPGLTTDHKEPSGDPGSLTPTGASFRPLPHSLSELLRVATHSVQRVTCPVFQHLRPWDKEPPTEPGLGGRVSKSQRVAEGSHPELLRGREEGAGSATSASCLGFPHQQHVNFSN